MKKQRPSSVNPQARQGHHHSSCAKNPQNDKPHAFISFHRGKVLSEQDVQTGRKICRMGGFFPWGQENRLQTAALSEKMHKNPRKPYTSGDFLLYARQESNL